jgi:LasA protease
MLTTNRRATRSARANESRMEQASRKSRRSRSKILPGLWLGSAVVIGLLLIVLVRCEGKEQPSSGPTTAAAALPTQAVSQTATLLPTAPTTATPDAVGMPDKGALSSASRLSQVYSVRKGDTLTGIASLFGCDFEALIADNNIGDANSLQVGQQLDISACQIETGPAVRLLPNSEFVNGPAYVGFDVAAFAEAQGGYLAKHTEKIRGKSLTGPEIVSLIAQRYSIGPRMLLAVLELKSGWVTDPNPMGHARDFPMGYKGGGWELLYWQLAWAADELNKGYYDWRGRGMSPIVWRDGSVVHYDPSLNAATAGLQYFLSKNANKSEWEAWVGEGTDGLPETYRRLFGDPSQYAIEPLIPANTTQPTLSLPWPSDELWYYTSGPHGGWEDGSAWAALDFVPKEKGLGCKVASSWATASAPGLLIHSQNGEVKIDLDGDGHEQTGWVLFYLHIAEKDRVAVGTRVDQGDPIGHPSCEGGISEATHIHFARKYNGEWIAADGPLPFVLSGWQAHSGGKPYDGTLTRDNQVRTACECWDRAYNGVKAPK